MAFGASKGNLKLEITPHRKCYKKEEVCLQRCKHTSDTSLPIKCKSSDDLPDEVLLKIKQFIFKYIVTNAIKVTTSPYTKPYHPTPS